MSDSREQDKFVVRLPEGLRPQIAAIARTNNRSMNGEIISRLQQSLSFEELAQQQSQLISQLLKRISALEASSC
jgi:D-alanyl-D-alanine carboxypeptidase